MLRIAQLDAVARQRARVHLSDAARARMERCYGFLQRLADTGVPVYGLTTGCGPLASQPIPPERREEFQRNLVRSHAASLGAPHPTPYVRAAMALRAHVLARGHSGVDPYCVELVAAMLNGGIHPVVREVGSVGASGDLVELAQLALAVLGEGSVEVGGGTFSAAQALRDIDHAPLVPRFREGLALMNGTSFHSAAAALLLARAARVAEAAQIAAAMSLEALHGAAEALDPALHAARPHPGQVRVAATLRRLTAGSTLLRRDPASAATQDAYTLRCIPQVLGTVLDILATAGTTVELELQAVSDNPLFLVDEERVVHGGNFHGQPVAMALDHLKMALVELGVLTERRLARLLDATLSGLPPFLIRDGAGLRSGFMGLQYCASSMAADNAVLAMPASVHSVPTNAGNQDVVSMGMVAARQARHVLDNVARVVAIELLCVAQALDLRGAHAAGAGTRAAYDVIRARSAPLLEDRPVADDVDAIGAMVEDETIQRAVVAATT